MGPDRGGIYLNSFIKLLLIFLLNFLHNNNNFVGAELRAKGSPHGVIQVSILILHHHLPPLEICFFIKHGK